MNFENLRVDSGDEEASPAEVAPRTPLSDGGSDTPVALPATPPARPRRNPSPKRRSQAAVSSRAAVAS